MKKQKTGKKKEDEKNKNQLMLNFVLIMTRLIMQFQALLLVSEWYRLVWLMLSL
jgi:hypothetical protein